MLNKLVISTRSSKLALWQANHVKNLLLKIDSNLDIDIIDSKTTGDIILDKPLYKIGGKGLFTKEIQAPLLNGSAHIAVHCLKDIPNLLDQGLGLKIGAFLKREESNDLFLSNKYSSLEDMDLNSTIGTTSLRRRMQLCSVRNNLTIANLRGNLDTRINSLNSGKYDAIILASAGIKRLDYYHKFKYVESLDEKIFIPSAGQGTLVIESINDSYILNLLKNLDDRDSKIESIIEVSFISYLDGDCGVPVGVRAKVSGDSFTINAMVGMFDGSKVIKYTTSGKLGEDNGIHATKEFAKKFIDNGAIDIIKESKIKLGI